MTAEGTARRAARPSGKRAAALGTDPGAKPGLTPGSCVGLGSLGRSSRATAACARHGGANPTHVSAPAQPSRVSRHRPRTASFLPALVPGGDTRQVPLHLAARLQRLSAPLELSLAASPGKGLYFGALIFRQQGGKDSGQWMLWLWA